MRIFLSVLALGAMPMSAMAATDISAAFGNTIVSTYPDKRTALLWMKPDGSYTAAGRRKTPSSGKWAMKDEKICLKQQRPFPVPVTYCFDLTKGAPTTGWEARAVTGEPIRVTIVKGVVQR